MEQQEKMEPEKLPTCRSCHCREPEDPTGLCLSCQLERQAMAARAQVNQMELSAQARAQVRLDELDIELARIERECDAAVAKIGEVRERSRLVSAFLSGWLFACALTNLVQGAFGNPWLLITVPIFAIIGRMQWRAASRKEVP